MARAKRDDSAAGITIRPATPADVPAVIALDQDVTSVLKTAYWNDMFECFGARRQDERFFLVADSGARIDGFIVGEVRAWEFGSSPSGWVFAVQVRPRLRVRGLGSRLFAAICERFRGAGIDRVRTMVARDNAVIHAFFRSQGMMAGPFIELEMRLD
jgi:ribosomal protein S18 acetylase RimI-like enzyme